MKRNFWNRKVQFIDKRMTALYVVFIAASIIVLAGSPLKDAMTMLIAIVAALAVFVQTKKNADTSKAEFILNLQQEFSSSEGFSDLFDACWRNYNDEMSNEELETYLSKSQVHLLNYLTFFESMYLIKEQGVINIKILDELFGRRFFIVVNNKTIQNFDLCKNAKYYTNVFYLYEDWSAYRIKKAVRHTDVKEAEIQKQELFIAFPDEKSRTNMPLNEWPVP